MTMKKIGLSLLLMLTVMSAWADVYQDPVTKVNYEYTPGVNQASVVKSADATGDITILSKFSVDGNEYTVTSIGENAFRKNTSLENIQLPSTIESIGWAAFNGCTKLTSISLPQSVTEIQGQAFRRTSISTFVFPEKVTTIADALFSECENLKEIVIPQRITSIGENAFEMCTSLESIVIPDGITEIKAMTFNNCERLSSISIPQSVTSIGADVFYGCTSLTSIQLPANLTSIGLGAFICCGLTSVTIPKGCRFGDEGYNNPFMNCISLESIKIEEGNPYYDSRNDCNAIIITATNRLIGGCKNTVIPSDVKVIDRYAFYQNGVEAITIPEGVEIIGESAFSRNNIASVEIPNTVTAIGEKAFYRNEKLTKLTIPASVKEIGEKAFLNTPLETVICNIEEPFALTEKTFGISTTAQSTGISTYETPSATLIVPKGAKAKYEAAEGWKQFKNIIEEGYYFYVHRASDFRLTEIMTRLWRENPDNNEGISTVVEVDKSFIEGLGNVQKLATIPTESMTLDIGERASNPEKKEFDCGTYKAEFDLNTIWVIIPEQWHNVCLPLNMRTTLDKKMAFPIVFSLSIEGVNYAVFSYLPDFSGNTVVYRPYHHFITEDGTCFKGDKETSTTTFAGRLDAWTVKDFAIPEQVENGGRTYVVDKIEMEALVAWNALQSVTIPNTIKSSFTFKDCNSLQKVTSLIEDPTDTSGSFKAERTVTTADGGTTTEYYTPSAVLYVPKGTVEKYKQAEGWKAFKYILEIGSPQPGDANCDGTVDVSDVTATVNSILDKEEGHFVESAADMNGDGIINVADIIIMVSHILKTEE